MAGPLRSMLARRQVGGEDVVFQGIAGDRMFLGGPGAEIDQLAAVGAEGAVLVVAFPFDGRAAGRALHGQGLAHARPPRKVR